MAYDDMLQAAVNSANPEPGIQQGIGSLANYASQYAKDPANQQASLTQKYSALVQSGQLDPIHAATLHKLEAGGHIPAQYQPLPSQGNATPAVPTGSLSDNASGTAYAMPSQVKTAIPAGASLADAATAADSPYYGKDMTMGDYNSLMAAATLDRKGLTAEQKLEIQNAVNAGHNTVQKTKNEGAETVEGMKGDTAVEATNIKEGGKNTRADAGNQTRRDIADANNQQSDINNQRNNSARVKVAGIHANAMTARESFLRGFAGAKTVEEKRKVYDSGVKTLANISASITGVLQNPGYTKGEDPDVDARLDRSMETEKAMREDLASKLKDLNAEAAKLPPDSPARMERGSVSVGVPTVRRQPRDPAPSPRTGDAPPHAAAGTDTTDVGGRVGAITDNLDLPPLQPKSPPPGDYHVRKGPHAGKIKTIYPDGTSTYR